MGYHRAGFEVVGVDIKPQPRYPFEFIQADAMTFPLEGFDAIHASPPCQGYSIMRNLPWLRDKEYPLLIEPTRQRLIDAGLPYVIENVMGAQRKANMQAAWLCGRMFGCDFFRHRLFESNFFWLQPGHPRHLGTVRPGRTLGSRARDIVAVPVGHSPIVEWREGRRKTSTNTLSKARREVVERAAEAMGINWMTAEELSQAIPPAYTEYIGKQLMAALRVAA